MCLRPVFLLLVFPLAALSFSQDTIRKHYEAAEAHKRAGNLIAAEAEFVAILAEGYDRLGKIYLAQKAYEKAATALETAALSRPEAPEALIDLAVAYFKAGQYEKASEPLHRALALNPRSADARHMLGKTHFMRGEFAKAAAELETALKLAPRDYDVAYTLGLARLNQGQLAPAKQIYSLMLRQIGNRPQLHIIFGRAYRETGFLAEAIEEFKKAIALDPKTVTISGPASIVRKAAKACRAEQCSWSIISRPVRNTLHVPPLLLEHQSPGSKLSLARRPMPHSSR